jgi:tetratricopeptide (TPR) repeat protein
MADVAKSWNERDVRGVELRAVSLHFDVSATHFEVLLGPLLASNCVRLQVQPLLEQSWTRLVSLRERLAGLRAGFTHAAIAQPMDRAMDALKTPSMTTLTDVVVLLESAFEACTSALGSDEHAGGLRALQALVVAVSFDFCRAAALSEEAALLADTDSEACWLYRLQQAEFLLDQGRERNDTESLQALVRLCEDTLLPLASANRDSAWVHDCLGQALGILGRQESGTATLDRAVKVFAVALELRDRDQSPYDWAATQNHFGNAIGSLGQRQQDLALLERSAAAFEAALEIPVSNAAPENRASAQNNLAAVLQTLGQQKKDAGMLERAVAAYHSALSTWTPDRKPLFWAATQSNLGSALRLLGGLREDAGILEQSVVAYRAALSARTRERMPREWALSQNDLGAALQAVGEMTEDTLTFGRSIAAYRDALKEFNREDEPMTWAMTTANLGVARRKLAEYTSDIDVSRRAIADIQSSLEVFRGANHARLTELGLEQLAIAMEVNAELESAVED